MHNVGINFNWKTIFCFLEAFFFKPKLANLIIRSLKSWLKWWTGVHWNAVTVTKASEKKTRREAIKNSHDNQMARFSNDDVTLGLKRFDAIHSPRHPKDERLNLDFNEDIYHWKLGDDMWNLCAIAKSIKDVDMTMRYNVLDEMQLIVLTHRMQNVCNGKFGGLVFNFNISRMNVACI